MTRFGLLVLLAACAAGERRGGQVPLDLDLDVPIQPQVATHDPAGAVAVAADPAAGAEASAGAPAARAVASVPAAPDPDGPAAPDPVSIARMGWPATTTSFVLKSSAHAYATPDLGSEPLGKILVGMRLPVGESVVGDRRCKVWLAAAPRGWICGRHARPSTLPPAVVAQPVLPAGRLLPQDYYGIKEGAPRYATADDVRAGRPRPEPKSKTSYMVTKDEVVDVDGERYVRTSVGLVAAADLYPHRPSTFAGIDLIRTPPPAWPFAWVIAPGGKTVTARATADKKGAAAGTFSHRAIVPVLEESGGFVRVADGQWLERASLRVARKQPRPAVADAPARWIDLDRDEQVMVAYDGETPVFATLFSSGRRKKDTPPALYRIRSKSALTKMAAEEREAAHYEVSEVPWATRFRSGLYFHAAYWHDQFGNARSHGCVNLSPLDARWVYEWTEPTMPAGWSELEGAVAGSMVVRVHDAKHPDPPLFDYDREAIERARIRKQEAALKKKREEAEAAAAAEAEAAAAAGSTAPAP